MGSHGKDMPPLSPKGVLEASAMKIIAGRFRGHMLAAPKGQLTRPTSGAVREAVFNRLVHADWAPRLEGARVIDLFAGSGALGLEALSRGAAFCLFVETDARARGAIRDNVERLGLYGVTRLHRRSATDLGPRPAGLGALFDLAFLDPPYRKGLIEPALASLAVGGWLAETAFAVVETAADEAPEPEGWEIVDRRGHGAAAVHMLRRSGA